VRVGEILTRKNIRCVRPGLGLPPQFYEALLGRRVNSDLKKGTPLNWSVLS